MRELVAFNVLCAIIAAKWGSDLGYTQFRQLLFGLAALVLGPLVLLFLYIYTLYKAKAEGKPSATWF